MKKILFTVLTVLLISSNALPANAALSSATITDDIVTPASEQTVWYNRIYNGKLQKRLWSITYNKWLTDWIDVE